MPGRAAVPIDAQDRAAVVKTGRRMEGERLMWRTSKTTINTERKE